MTSKLILRFLRTAALTCLLLLGNTAMAQGEEFQSYHVDNDYNPIGIIPPNVKFYFNSSCQNFELSQMYEQAIKAVAKADRAMHSITINLEYDDEVFQAPYMAYITDDTNIVGWAFTSGWNVLSTQVEEGTYNIIACFNETEDYNTRYYTIKEDVEVTGDMTITLNPAEATNHITTKIYGPNGDLLKFDLAHFDEETHKYVIDDPGEVKFSNVTNTLYQKGLGGIYSFSTGGFGPATTEEDRILSLDFYVNDVSDRFAFIQERIEFNADLSKSYCTRVSTDNLVTSELENTPNDFVQQVYNYKYTPYGRYRDDGICIGVTFWEIAERAEYCYFWTGRREAKENDSFPHEMWINVPDVDPNIPGLNVLLQIQFADYGEVGHYSWGEDFTPTGWTFGTPIQVKNGQAEFVNFGHTDNGGNMKNTNFLYAVKKNNTIFNQLLPAPEAFTYPADQALGNFGDNCPINALNVTTYENNGQVTLNITNYYVGRYGEVLCCDMGSTLTAKFNGEDIDLSTYVPEGLGAYEFIDNNPNVEVDGLPGHVTTTVFFDQNQEDMTPPSIEMLHFRNGEGGVTDRFATAADGTLEFYASDFNYHYYPELWGGVFECQPMVVLVEYAPYGTEDWTELTVEEVPEFYQEPGWGYFYRGSLADVTGQGEKGWFDLKFRLEDGAGNWQEQVVSPAFRIDDHAFTSVATIDADKAHEVARYSIDGKRVDANHHGVTIIRMSDGTSRKVFVK